MTRDVPLAGHLGGVLDVVADVLVATANPWLQMTGGVNLAIILRPRQRRVRPFGPRGVTPRALPALVTVI